MLHLRHRSILTLIAVCLVLIVTAGTGAAKTRSSGLYPDLRTVVPTHLQLVNQQQRTLLRFSNGIANTGDGPWRLRHDFQSTATNAIQEILGARGSIGQEYLASAFEV